MIRLASCLSLIFPILVGGTAHSAPSLQEHAESLNAEMVKKQPDRESVLLFIELGIVEFTVSENGTYAGITTVEHEGQPRSFIFDSIGGEVVSIGRGLGIEFDLFVSEDKNYVYSVYEYTGSISYLVSDLGSVGEREGLYRQSLIHDGALFSHFFDRKKDQNFLFVYDIDQKRETYIEIDFYVDSLSLYGGEGILLQGIPTSGDGRVAYLYAPGDAAPRSLRQPEDTYCFVSSDRQRFAQEPLCLAEARERLEYLVGRELWTRDPARLFACSGNDLGRLSWHASYELIALMSFAEHLEPSFPLSEVVSNAMNCLIDSARFESRESFGWPTKKYSLDRTSDLSLMVDNANIIHAMLVAVRSRMLAPLVEERIVEIAREAHERYEADYVEDIPGQYRFPRDIPFQFDGVFMPYNQQNAYGLALLELYAVTADEVFKRRAEALAQRFRSDWVFNENGAALWYYWPPEVRRGWDETDDVSVNTPKWAASDAGWFEDVGHAGLNIDFVLEVARRLPNSPFSESDIASLEKTLGEIRSDGLYVGYLAGERKSAPRSRRFTPKFAGWLKIADARLIHETSLGLPTTVPYFDLGALPAFLNVLNRVHQLSSR